MALYMFDGKRPVIGPGTFIHPLAVVIGEATIGRDCHVAAGAVIRADFAPITIGDNTSIQDNAVLHVTPGDGVSIGNNVIVAHGAIIHDVVVADGCVIGMGAVVLQKVRCGEGAVVAAGAVVPPGMDIPPGKLVAGNPARIVKDVPPELRDYAVMGVAEYKRLTNLYLATFRELPEFSPGRVGEGDENV
ncbi:MAG: gamma carbonic anhydrase family protein [Syntrophales bacterium]|nr:gamma carbonic anhydrase family protein [Syntrophales bacterium]